MTATEQAIAALRSAAHFADYVSECRGDEDAIRLRRQCAEAIGSLKAEIERTANPKCEEKKAIISRKRIYAAHDQPRHI